MRILDSFISLKISWSSVRNNKSIPKFHIADTMKKTNPSWNENAKPSSILYICIYRYIYYQAYSILFSVQMTLEQCRELGASTLNAVKKPCLAFQVVLCVLGSTSMDSTNWGLCATVIFTIERNPLSVDSISSNLC